MEAIEIGRQLMSLACERRMMGLKLFVFFSSFIVSDTASAFMSHRCTSLSSKQA